MDFLEYSDVTFDSNANIGLLREELNHILGESIWHDMFRVQNTKWLWLVNGVVAAMNSDKVRCGALGLYPCFVAGILNSIEEINFYVLCT
jgi:hypothetical protein